MSRPSTCTLPDVALTMPQTMLIRVVLPAPLGPSSAKISPLLTVRLTSLKATTPDAYFLPRSAMARVGFIAATLPQAERDVSIPSVGGLKPSWQRGSTTPAG